MAHKTMLRLDRASLDVMHVLVNAVYADHVVDGKEIETIVDALGTLNIRSDEGEVLNKVDLLYWLEANYKEIVAQYSGSKRDIELVILLSRMKRRDDLDVIMKVIMDICHVDGVYHEDEKVLTETIRSHWF